MKSIKEIQAMLGDELSKHLNEVKTINSGAIFYNRKLGDTSFLLAGLLDLLLKDKCNEWEVERWIDDSLIATVIIRDNKLIIVGVMIFGKMNTTQQWTYPFHFETNFSGNEIQLKTFTYLFGDLDYSEITYEEFRGNHDYWNNNNRNWKYIINIKAK